MYSVWFLPITKNFEQEGYGDLGTQALMKFYDEEHRNMDE